MHYDCFMGALLEIRNLRIRFGAAEAVRGISLSLDEGEVLGMVGESGSGKSATALAILGLLGSAARVEGRILWRGGGGVGEAGEGSRFPTHSAKGREMDGARSLVGNSERQGAGGEAEGGKAEAGVSSRFPNHFAKGSTRSRFFDFTSFRSEGARSLTRNSEGLGSGGESEGGRDDGSGAIDLVRQTSGALRRLRGREIAMIFQEPMTALNPVITIGRQVAESFEAHAPSWTGQAWTGCEAKRKAIAALEAVAISDAARRYGDYPHQFSGGQRQRILIAMALINKPRLLIADEPTTALDVTVQAQVLELLKDLQREHGLAMLFISHDLAVVGQMASRLAVMRGGVVVETGPCSRLLTNPEHSYTRSLLAAVPTLRTDRSRPLAMVGGSQADAGA